MEISELIPLIIVILFIALMLIASVFMFGTKYPDKNTVKKIGDDAIIDNFFKWYVGSKWKCVNVLHNQPGPFGTPMTNIIVENQRLERIRLIGHEDIKVGDEFECEPTTEEERRSGVWFSPAGPYIKLKFL